MESSIIGYSRGDYSAKTFQAVNPANGEKLSAHYAFASSSDVDKACEIAADAAMEMAGFDGKKKAVFLRCLADGIDEITDLLVEIMRLETGLPEPRVRGETGRTSGQLRMFANLVEEGNWVDARIDRAQPERQPLPKPDLRSMLRPMGPVAVFCASNFPLAFSVAGGDSASAWAAGCPVVVKAHHAHPGTALLVAEKVVDCLKACDWPEGAFSLLFGEGRTVGQALVSNPSIKAVGFTGSRSGGKALFDVASCRPEPIPVFAEMSSINPIVVFNEMDDQTTEEFTDGLMGSATLGTGQFCTNPGVVFHPGGNWGKTFVSSYAKKMSEFSPCPMLHKGIRQAYLSGLNRLSSTPGIEVVHQSELDLQDPGCLAGTCVMSTHADNFLNDESMMDEVFGPSTLLVAYDSKEQLMELTKRIEGQLTISLFGENSDLIENESLIAFLETKAGRILFNQFPTGVEVCPSVVHGGPYPATSDSRSTSVGTGAILRFARPICYQGFPDKFLPVELQEKNPLGIRRSEV